MEIKNHIYQLKDNNVDYEIELIPRFVQPFAPKQRGFSLELNSFKRKMDFSPEKNSFDSKFGSEWEENRFKIERISRIVDNFVQKFLIFHLERRFLAVKH